MLLETPGGELEGSMGMLGIVAELTLSVVPLKKVAVKQLQQEDGNMVTDFREIIENSEAVALDAMWSPSAAMYTARVWHETEALTPGDAANIFLRAPEEWLTKVCLSACLPL